MLYKFCPSSLFYAATSGHSACARRLMDPHGAWIAPQDDENSRFFQKIINTFMFELKKFILSAI